MKSALTVALLLVANTAVAGKADLEQFAERYFDAWHATQQPGATPAVLDAYLALLDEDVGYEHKPYRLLEDAGDGSAHGAAPQRGSPSASGKALMREGMTFYLGKNSAYDAKLVSVATADNAVALQYEGVHVFRRGGEGPEITERFTAMDVLEVSEGRVIIIRHFRD
ncbi:MAG: nuclear transport factor 2 family protein [Pseudomonadota bacterium]